MKPTDLRKLEGYLHAFLWEMFEGLGRRERLKSMSWYVTGLLLDGERKSTEPMAARLVDDAGEVSGMRQRLQECVSISAWSKDVVLSPLAAKIEAELADVEALVIGDTSFPKKGEHSVGVQRQYSGTLARQDNGQVATSLHLAGEQGSACIALRLYMPEPWCSRRWAATESEGACGCRVSQEVGDKRRANSAKGFAGECGDTSCSQTPDTENDRIPRRLERKAAALRSPGPLGPGSEILLREDRPGVRPRAEVASPQYGDGRRRMELERFAGDVVLSPRGRPLVVRPSASGPDSRRSHATEIVAALRSGRASQVEPQAPQLRNSLKAISNSSDGTPPSEDTPTPPSCRSVRRHSSTITCVFANRLALSMHSAMQSPPFIQLSNAAALTT